MLLELMRVVSEPRRFIVGSQNANWLTILRCCYTIKFLMRLSYDRKNGIIIYCTMYTYYGCVMFVRKDSLAIVWSITGRSKGVFIDKLGHTRVSSVIWDHIDDFASQKAQISINPNSESKPGRGLLLTIVDNAALHTGPCVHHLWCGSALNWK